MTKPPPIPLFRRTSVTARLSGDLLVIAPTAGHAFESPRGTVELYLPSATTVSVAVDPLADGWATLVSRGATPCPITVVTVRQRERVRRCDPR